MTKLAEEWSYDPFEDRLTIKETHDPTPVIDSVQKLKNEGRDGFSEHKHVGRIPFWLIEQWIKEEGVSFQDQEKVKEVVHAFRSGLSSSGLRKKACPSKTRKRSRKWCTGSFCQASSTHFVLGRALTTLIREALMADQMGERLSRIEAGLDHVIKSVDRAEQTRESTLERLTRVEARIDQVEKHIPQIDRNAIRGAKSEAWRNAKEDAADNRRATVAIGVSVLAFFTSVIGIIVKWTNQ